MNQRNGRRILSILSLIGLVFTSLVTVPPPQIAQAAFIGNDGAIPAGGTSGPRTGEGVCGDTIYRIGITSEVMSPDHEFGEHDANDTVIGKLLDHYATHLPRLQNSILFAPDKCYTTNAAIGWYQASSGSLVVQRRNLTDGSAAEKQARIQLHDARLRKLIPTNIDPGQLFYASLLAKAPENKPGNFSELVNGQWKSIVASKDPNGAKSYGVWNYIFGSKPKISDRIKGYIGEALMDENKSDAEKHKGELMYADLLMTLYSMSPNGVQKDFYYAAIERFFKRDDLAKRPITFAVDTAARFSSPLQLGNTYLYIPSVDYVQWMHGGTPQTSITSSDFTTTSFKHDTRKLIMLAAMRSMEQAPNRKRNTDKPGDTDGFTWGYSGVVGEILRTDSASGTAKWISSTVTGVMESLVFHDKAFGFMIAGGPHNKATIPPPCSCNEIVSITNKSEVESKLVSNTVGKYVSMSIDMKESDPKKLDDWKQLMDGSSDLQMKVRLWRSQAPGSAKWIKISGPDPATDEDDDKWVDVTQEQIWSYLGGTKLSYNDDLTQYKIPNRVNQEFRYNASVFIKGINVNGEPFSVQCAAGQSISLFITGPSFPGSTKSYYTSQPSYWSEIKEGSPGNETFEAMAGTPTTRSLYFATGGSEFIVDVEVEYVPDMTSTRTYRSYFSGVPSEFKEGDQAKAYTVPSPSGAGSSSLTVNAHQGGTVKATWTGALPYTGAVTWGDHWVNVNNKWDYSAYNTAKSQAQAWAGAVNGFTISHKAASDGITRKFNGWGAHITTDSKVEPKGYANPGQKEIPCTPVEGGGCVGGQSYVASSGQNGADGTFTITVEGTIPARIIDGPSSIYDLPAIEDTWTQTVTYDYTKINKAKVWKIEQSKVNGMVALTGTNEITASIAQGNPTLFYNIADESKLSTEASKEGRLRYALETDQHDVVVWNEGPRSNKDDGRGDNGWIKGPGQSANWAHGIIYTNPGYSDTPEYHAAHATAKDKLTPEYRTFDQRRKTKKGVTAISDFLILQTSSGDQSVMYFEKTSAPVEAQRQVDIPKTTKEAQWEDNPLSAADWSPDQIHIGSYNGQYYSPATKYSTFRSSPIATVFDRLPGGMVRPARPTSALRLMQTGIGVNTIPNGEYVTGDSSVFYKLILDRGDGGTIYPTGHNAKYNGRGAEFVTAYSDSHNKVNNIVIHNPVSAEDAAILPYRSLAPLEPFVDQRTDDTARLGGNMQPPTMDYERRLKPGYVFTPQPPVFENRTVPNPDYQPAQEAVSEEYAYNGTVQKFVAPRDGTYTIEAWGAQGGNVRAALEYEWYNPVHGVYLWYPGNVGYDWVYCENHSSYPTGNIRGGAVAEGGKGAYAKGTADLRANEILKVYVGGKGTDGSSGSAAGGWNGGGNGSYYSGGGGGASDVRKDGENLGHRILVAGGGGGAQWVPDTNYRAPGGVGGGVSGGNGNSHGYWRTDYVSTGGTQSSGGTVSGQITYEWYNSYHNVYLWYFSNTGHEWEYCVNHPSAPTGRTVTGTAQGNPGALGQGGHYMTTYEGGGGGGYYGGASGAYLGYSGSGGSGYIGGVSGGSMSSGVRSGNGLVRITTPGVPAVGSPDMVVSVMVDPGMSEPPEDAYEYVQIVHSPDAAVDSPYGSFKPGKLINLDHAFYVSFPNRGDFFGNGATGLYTTSPITGKGYTNRMDTTEWTAAKQVKFDFFATYQGKTYSPGEWIDLEVGKEIFEFYLPLANSEAISALVEFRTIANNAPYPDGESVRNKVRFENLGARHSAIKGWNIDVVGTIGGLVIEDTGDFRFSNLFKQGVDSADPSRWFIPNVVKKVDKNRQNRIVGDLIDVRGEKVSSSTHYLDTYGLLPHLRQSPISLPLSPDKNNLAPLQRQPMRLGYHVLSDIQTIGNYYHDMEIVPYYYSLNLKNGEISPVDIYMDVKGQYQPINKFGVVVEGWDRTSVYPFEYSLDWNAEAGRRNYFESQNTDDVVADNTFIDDSGTVTTFGQPKGGYIPSGTAQVIQLTGQNRTFTGTDRTYGIDRNPEGLIHPLQFAKQAQRWHFTYGLPSSAVAVKRGQLPAQSNIDAVRNNTTVIVAALKIKAFGDTYVLQYGRDNGSLNIAGTTWSLASIEYPVVSIYSAHKSSADDLSVSGTH